MFFFASRRRHTSWPRDWSSDVCSSDLLHHRIFNMSSQVPVFFRLFKFKGFRGGLHLIFQILHDLIEIGRASCRERVWMSECGGVLWKNVSGQWATSEIESP